MTVLPPPEEFAGPPPPEEFAGSPPLEEFGGSEQPASAVASNPAVNAIRKPLPINCPLTSAPFVADGRRRREGRGSTTAFTSWQRTLSGGFEPIDQMARSRHRLPWTDDPALRRYPDEQLDIAKADGT
jgi:hypothetical protein